MSQPDEILTILARDARTSADTIATLTGRDPAEVRATIAEYEQRGIIKHYKTIVDWEKAGVEKVFAFIDVKVLPAREVGFDAVAERIYRYPEVHSVWLVSGGSDLRVVVEGENMRVRGPLCRRETVRPGRRDRDRHALPACAATKKTKTCLSNPMMTSAWS